MIRRPQERELRSTLWRLGVQTAALLLCSLAVVSTLVVVTVLSSQDAQAQARLETAISRAAGAGSPDRDGDETRTDIAIARARDGGRQDDDHPPASTMPAGLPDRAVMAEVARTGIADQRTVALGSHRYLVRTERRGQYTIQAALDLYEQQEEFDRVVQAIVVAGSAGVVLATGIAVWLASRAVRPLAQALAMQRRFVADAGHELRTPLTLLSTRAQLLQRRLDRGDPADARVRADTLDDARGLVADSRNLSEILEDLLLTAETSTPLPGTPVDLALIASEAADAGRALADERGVSVTVTGEVTAPLATGVRAALLRAVTALLDNAVSHARTQVLVDVVRRRDSVIVTVSDDGRGLSPESMPALFERFASQRPSDPEAGQPRHYGLGLALVAEIAARHGGTVSAANRDDAPGAVFELRLPAGRA